MDWVLNALRECEAPYSYEEAKTNIPQTINWCSSCGMKCMAQNDSKERIEHIKAQIKAAEETYSNAINAKKDYNTLKSIRTEISNLKKELQELQDK